MKLNEHQEKAVRSVRGRVLVLAGAGSGKTRVIVHRIAHLIQDLGVSPQSILGLTFTNKAAAEMRHRLEKLIGSPLGKQVTLCTFHSFCMRVLRKEIEKLGYTREFSLYDERDMQRVIQQLTREMLNHEGELPSLAPTKAALTLAANQGFSAKTAEEEGTWHDTFSKDLYVRLQSSLRAYNAVSFDSLISLTISLFEEHPNVLDLYQEQFKYLMIDEYQDTNPAQFRLAELMAAKYNNLCVVGDDDQSIYGWRGADVKNILNFKADQTIKLEQNYRSTSSILDAANAVISNNQTRYNKKLWCSSGPADLIEVFNAPTDIDEAAAVVNRMIKLKSSGMKWKDMAILYRSNALSRQFEVALMQASWSPSEGKFVRGIPYEVFGGLEFSERSEIKDLFAYLRVIANPLDQEALLRIINVPRRGVSDTILDQLTQESRSKEIPLWHFLKEIAEGTKTFPSHAKAMKGISFFVDLIETAAKRFQKPPFGETLTWLIEKIDYKKAIHEEVKSEKMRQFKWENVQECVNALAQTEESSLQDFIANSTLNRQIIQSQSKQTNEDKVHLMTLHSAKGLEFPFCFMVGLEDRIIPHEKSMAETGLEEERRLFYVGITRAQKHLTLSMARSRMKMGKAQPSAPSRFLFEIPKVLLKVTDHKIFL